MHPLSLAAKMKIGTQKGVHFVGSSSAYVKMFLHLDLASRWNSVGVDGFGLTMADPF